MTRQGTRGTEDAAFDIVARASKARGESVAVFAIPSRASESVRLMRERPDALVGVYDADARVRDVEGDLLDTKPNDAK